MIPRARGAQGLRVLAVNLGLLLVGVGLVLAGGEWWVRRTSKAYDLFAAGYEKPWFRNNPADLTRTFTVDPAFGFRPNLEGGIYNGYGTLRNDYPPAKPPGRQRVLFVGDSVTRIGFIVKALREVYGDEKYEYWNAGVDSFNTVQELAYYREFNSKLAPDQVILTFNNNDFETTPIVFLNEKGQMVFFSTYLPRRWVNGWLFQRSHLYRMALGRVIAFRKDQAREQIVQEVRDSLQQFAAVLREEGVPFTVLVHPILVPKEKWLPGEVRNHETVLRFLDELGIRHFDLAEPLWSFMAAGGKPQWTQWKNDRNHPSPEAARAYAEHLFSKGLLEEVPAAKEAGAGG